MKERNSVAKYLELADAKEYQNFQTDSYGYEYIYHNHSRIDIGYRSITLAMEGKISMECYGKHFSFFESLIKKSYPDFQLAQLIKIAISG